MLRAATVLSGWSLTQGYVNLLSGPALEEVTEQVCLWRFLSSPLFQAPSLHPVPGSQMLANLGSVLPGTISILRWVTTAGQWGSLGAKTHIKLPWTDGQKVLVLTSRHKWGSLLHYAELIPRSQLWADRGLSPLQLRVLSPRPKHWPQYQPHLLNRYHWVSYIPGFPGSSVGKDPPAMQETPVWFLGLEDPLEEG